QKRLHKPPSELALTDLDTSLIGAFLDELEKDRGNGARSRNLRLTAIRSFYYVGRGIQDGARHPIGLQYSFFPAVGGGPGTLQNAYPPGALSRHQICRSGNHVRV